MSPLELNRPALVRDGLELLLAHPQRQRRDGRFPHHDAGDTSSHPLILHNSAEKAIMRGLYKREETLMSLHARIHFINFSRTLTVASVFFLIPLHFLKIGFNGMQIGAGSKFNLETLSGGIEVFLPANAAFELDAETFSGHVRSDFPITMQGKISPRELRGVVNNGGATLRLKTFSGSIYIRKK